MTSSTSPGRASALVCLTSLDPTTLFSPRLNASLQFDIPEFIQQVPRPFGRARYFSLWHRSKDLPEDAVRMRIPGTDTVAQPYGFYTFSPDQTSPDDTGEIRSFILTDPLPLRRNVHAPRLPNDHLRKPLCFFYMPISALGMTEGAQHV